MKPFIAPSILNFPVAELRDPVRRMGEAGASWLHVDVMDGQFVPPISFGDCMVRSVKEFCSFPIEAHLMTLTPDRQVESFAEAGCKRLTFHLEATPHAHRVVQAIHHEGMEAGIAINPATPFQAVEPLLDLVELVLVMTVNPGYGGQTFLPETLSKVRSIRSLRADVTIEVDGGIDPNTISRAHEAGADLFVVGSYLLKPPTIGDAFAALEAACALKS